MAAVFKNFQALDLSNSITEFTNGATVFRDRLYISTGAKKSWYIAGIDGQGNLTNISNSSFNDLIEIVGWRRFVICNDKVIFVHDYRYDWMIADIESDGRFSNYRVINMDSKLTTTSIEWETFVIHNNKVIFVNSYRDKWMTADIPSNWDCNPLNLTNFQTLDLTNNLTTNRLVWSDLKIINNKAVFMNGHKENWMIADIDSNGNFSNFQTLDLTSNLPDGGFWDSMFIHNNKIFFVNTNTDKWMTADIEDGGTTPTPPSTNWHYGDGHGGPSLTTNDWEGSFNASLPGWQKEFVDFDYRIPDVERVDHDYIGIPKFGSLTAISLPNTVHIGKNVFSAASIHELNLPKAITIGENAFSGIKNEASTIVHMKARFNTVYYKNLIFGVGNWNNITFNWLPDTEPHPTSPSSIPPDHEVEVTWHYGDGAGGPHATKNDWAGSFSSHNKQLEFEAITDHVDDHEFNAQEHLMAISLPQVTKIGLYSFFISKMGAVNLPKVLSIGNNALYNTANNVRTTVTLPDVFNTDAEKNRIFGDHQWGHMTFIWKHDAIPANTIFWNGKIQDTQFEMDGKTVVKFVWLNGPVTTIAPTDSFTITRHQTSVSVTDRTKVGIVVDETKKFTQFASDVVFDPSVDAYGNHAVYTKKELNDWLKNPASVSGDPVANDWRITSGTSPDDAKSNLAIEFKEVDGKRIITRIFLKPKNALYPLFANHNILWTLTVDNGSEELKECVLKKFELDFNPNSGTFRSFDISSVIPPITGVIFDIKIYKNKAFFIANKLNSWLTADVDDIGNFSNFKILDLSSKITNENNQWRSIEFHNNKAYIINFTLSHWMVADINDDGDLSNFTQANFTSGFISSGWFDMEIYKNKAFFAGQINHYKTADIDSSGNFTNFQDLDLTSKLTTSTTDWRGMEIYRDKVYFPHYIADHWMTSDIDNNGNLSNFQVFDLSSKLTASSTGWLAFRVINGRVYFINSNKTKWMIWEP